MADPFSVFSSALSLIDIATRISASLLSIYSELKNAPMLILALSNEVADISLVLDRVYNARQAPDGVSPLSSNRNTTYLAALDNQLEKARALLVELEALSTNLTKEKGLKTRITWILNQSNAEALKNQLIAARTKINEILLAYNTYVSLT